MSRQFYTIPGLLNNRAALSNSYPYACVPMQGGGGNFYHFYDGLWLVVFIVPSTARSFRDGTPIYCPFRRTWSSINTPFRPGFEPRAVAWQSITLPLRYAGPTVTLTRDLYTSLEANTLLNHESNPTQLRIISQRIRRGWSDLFTYVLKPVRRIKRRNMDVGASSLKALKVSEYVLCLYYKKPCRPCDVFKDANYPLIVVKMAME